MKKKIAILLCLGLCLSVFGSLSIIAETAPEVTYSVDGVVDTSVTTLDKAFEKANTLTEEQTATITLLKDVSCDVQLQYKGAGALLFNGDNKKINTTVNMTGGFIYMNATGSFTIEDTYIENTATETAASHNAVIVVENGTMTVNDCNFKTNHLLFYSYSQTNTTVLDINGGTYTSALSNQPFFNTRNNNSTNASSMTLTIDDANLLCNYNGISQNLFYLGRHATGTYDTVTLTNTAILAPGAKSLLNIVTTTGTTVNFNSCRIYLADTTSNNIIVAQNSSQVTWKKTVLVGCRDTGYLGGNLSPNYAFGSITSATVFDGTNRTEVKKPELQGEASVRLDEAGIRFRTVISKEAVASYAYAASALKSDTNTATDVTVSYGTLVMLQSQLDAAGITTANIQKGYNVSAEFLDALDIGYIDIVANKGITKDSDGNIEYVAALDGITEAYYKAGIATIAYAKVTIGEEEFYFYSSFDPSQNTHCIADVAQQAIDSGNYSGAALAQLKMYAGVTEGN